MVDQSACTLGDSGAWGATTRGLFTAVRGAGSAGMIMAGAAPGAGWAGVYVRTGGV